MEDYIMTIIKRVSVFMILAQVFIHFRPSPVYEKYFKFLIGIMTTIMLVLPVTELFCEGSMERYQQQMTYYINELEQRSANELPDFVSPDASYLTSIEQEVKSRLNKSLSRDGYIVEEIELQEKEMKVKAYLRASQNAASTIYIEKVEKIQLEETERETRSEKELRLEIAKILELEEESVEVEIIEG